MTDVKIDEEAVATILLSDGKTIERRVRVLGIARAGGMIRVEMIDGAVEVDLPAGTQTLLAPERFDGEVSS